MKTKAVVGGLLAGLAGVAAMTLAEKLEQSLTKRPDSYVPAHTLERLLGLAHKPDRQRVGINWSMHWGQGIVLGVARGLMAQQGIRGPVGSFLFMNLRLNSGEYDRRGGITMDLATRRTTHRLST